MPGDTLKTILDSITVFGAIATGIWGLKSSADKLIEAKIAMHKQKMDAEVDIARENSLGKEALGIVKDDVESLKEDMKDEEIKSDKIIKSVNRLSNSIEAMDHMIDRVLRVPSARATYNLNPPPDEEA